ncbi:MAG: FAD:protein FMN transferase [Clostridia bacterium]
MRKIFFAASILICLLMCGCSQNTVKEYTDNIFAMDTVMDLKIYSENDESLSKAKAEIRRIDALFDRGNENSDIYRINKNKSADVSAETADVIRAALLISERTGGAFDITVAPVMDLWGFYGNEFNVPSDDELQSTLDGVGYEKIQLDGTNISIPENTGIDLGGIGKGYTSDRVADLLKNNGVESAIISLGGNVHAIGKRNDGSNWTVGITDPHDKSQLIGKLKISDKAVITSGAYQRYFEQNGIMYHHIVDPKSGKSADSGLASVTVIADSGMTADGLSTALFVLGLDKSIELWRNSEDFDAVFVDEGGMIYVTEGIADIFESDADYSICRKNNL